MTTTATILTDVPACEVRIGDILFSADRSTRYLVLRAYTTLSTTRITRLRTRNLVTFNEHVYPVAPDRVMTVLGVETCDTCDGTGKHYGRGYTENGVFKGRVGKCYRCNGKGTQDRDDRVRNWVYDAKYRRA